MLIKIFCLLSTEKEHMLKYSALFGVFVNNHDLFSVSSISHASLYFCSVFYFETFRSKLTLFHKHPFRLTNKYCWNFFPRAIIHQDIKQQNLSEFPLVSSNFLWNCTTSINLHSLVSLHSYVIKGFIDWFLLFPYYNKIK